MIRSKKAGDLESGDVVALPFEKTATVNIVTVQSRNRIIVKWADEGLRPTTYEVDTEVFVDVPEYLPSNESGDAWQCICGNDVMTGGFYPSDPNVPYEVEPVIGGTWDEKHILCATCGRIMDQSTLTPNPESTDEWDTHTVKVVHGPNPDIKLIG